MRTLRLPLALLLVCTYLVLGGNDGCPDDVQRLGPPPAAPVAASGVQKMTVKVDTNESGHTVEQENIAARYKMDNEPGAVKWLYLISSMSGDVILASSVKGKVTSSGKRLTPTTVAAGQVVVTGYSAGTAVSAHPMAYGATATLPSGNYATSEVIQDDGTYGSSGEYLFWWDIRGQYHQQYLNGALIHISDKPMHWPKIVLNLDATAKER